MGGGGSSQSVMQTATTTQTSTTNAQHTYNFEVTQSGLTPAQAQQLVDTATSGTQQLEGILAGTADAAGNPAGAGSTLVYLVVLIVLAALVFRR